MNAFNQDALPIHTTSIDYLLPRLRYLVNFYKIDYNLARMQTPGDEMELYAAVNRKFRELFAKQEHMKSFRVYDAIEAGSENWGTDSPIHALKKEANWLEFIQLIANKDPVFEKDMAKIKQRNMLDQFLIPHSNFIEINNDERVQDALRENAMLNKNKHYIEPTSVTTNVTMFNTNALWKKVFHNPNLSFNKKQSDGDTNINKSPVVDDTAQAITFRNKSNKKLDDFNFTENLQKLGLDDSKTSSHNLTNVQGSYLAYLNLRHLRIRDLKRQALSYLNYFRSIEKTLTIYDGGLSLESKKFKRQSGQNHVKETPFGENLGYHAYMFNSPKDYKISENEFMEFSEIENHDDFYSHDDMNFVHVQDQRGYYIVYDVAVNDLKKIESELHLIASYYISKEKEVIDQNLNEAMRKPKPDMKSLNLNEYSHQNIDRFAILMDIWTNEVNFLEVKKNLMSVYFEAYQNIFDKNEKRNLAQIMTNLMYQRVRFDLTSNYFAQSYRFEVSCLSKRLEVVKHILNKMIEEMRGFLERNESNKQYGMPYSVIKKNLICLSPNPIGSTLKNLYMLEFHPCLASVTRIEPALKTALEELVYFKSANSINDRLNIEQAFLASYLSILQTQHPPGYSFAPQIQKDVFNCPFIEDSTLISEFLESTLKQQQEANKAKTKKEQHEAMLTTSSHVLELITLRYRLVNLAIESEVLSKIYKKQSNEMGFEDFHMFLRCVQFDFAKFKDGAGQPPPTFITEINTEDTAIDRYVPNGLGLAAHEIDEGQIGKFSFKNRESVLQILKGAGIENLQLIVKLQVTHNNALISAIMQSHSCFLTMNLAPRKQTSQLMIGGNQNNIDLECSSMKYSEKLEDSKVFSTKRNAKSAKTMSDLEENPLKKFAESFTSLQIEKNVYREMMHNDFIKMREKKAHVLSSNQTEMEKLKRNLMNEYANRFNQRVMHNSLRSQLIILFYSIARLLENFPNTRDSHFCFGEPHEKRPQTKITDSGNLTEIVVTDDNIDFIKPDARRFKNRPRKILSDDGERVLNIWFIPHFTEVLSMYKKRSDMFCCKSLRYCLRIFNAMNDILHYIHACACMQIAVTHGSSSNDTSTAQVRRKIDFTSWENAGGLDAELNDIQLEINQLNDPCDPEQVADLLEAKRTCLFLQYECAIRYAIRDVFLANGNQDVYKLMTENMHFSLRFLNDLSLDTSENVYLGLPEPLDPRDPYSSAQMPWRTFMAKNGIAPLHYWPWYLIESNINLCVTGLNDNHKNVANGEILGVSLMMEDLLLCNTCSSIFKEKSSTDSMSISEALLAQDSTMSLNSNASDQKKKQKPVSKLVKNYREWQFFLLTWKRCELLKSDWGKRKLGVESINNSDAFARFCENYRKDILLPVLKILVKSSDVKEQYDNIVDFKQPILLPPDASELDSKVKQIARLLEKMEYSMIDETVQRVQKEIKLVLSERSREENTLTTDLWKRSIMKEEFTINKPHIANEFSSQLFNILEPDPSQSFKQSSSNTIYILKEKDLKKCLLNLGNMVQERERSNFEQYTMFYENLLRGQHQLLYNREREIELLKDNLEKQQASINVEIQTQMADACYDLIMEVTALRSKMNEVAETKEIYEKELREKIKGEFIDLINDLVNLNASLRSSLDTFKEEVHVNVLELIGDVRKHAFEETHVLKASLDIEIDELARQSQIEQHNLIYDLQSERDLLRQIIIKQKAFDKLKVFTRTKEFNKKLSEITEESDKIKKKAVNNSLHAEERQILISQQKIGLKKQLALLDMEFNNLKVKLNKELKEKQNREHELQQKMKNEKNLTCAKKSNVEKLFEELEQKDIELRTLYMKTEKTTRMQSLTDNKIQKEVSSLKKNLLHERHLKLDAFQKVDELQSHLYDLEDEITNIPTRPHTSVVPSTPSESKSSRLYKRSNSSNGMNSAMLIKENNTQKVKTSAFPRLYSSLSSSPANQVNQDNKLFNTTIKPGDTLKYPISVAKYPASPKLIYH